jgi:DNA polymerase-3 subunit gamma/tau
VARGEKLKVDKETLEVIAKASDGSFRDATKILEQLTSEGRKLKKEDIEELLFQKKALDVETLLGYLKSYDSKAALENIEASVAKGVSVPNLLTAVLERLREGLLFRVGVGQGELPRWEREEIISLIKAFYLALKEMSGAPLEQLPMEVAIVDWCYAHSPAKGQSILMAVDETPQEKTKEPLTRLEVHTEASASSQKVASPISKIEEVTEEVWKRILSAVRPINTSIEALLRAAKPIEYDGQTLTLGVFYRFHKERLEEGMHRRILEDVVATVMGVPVKVACILTEPPVKNPVEEKRQEVVLTEGEDADIIKAAKEIFGT